MSILQELNALLSPLHTGGNGHIQRCCTQRVSCSHTMTDEFALFGIIHHLLMCPM